MSNQEIIDWRTPITPAEITWQGETPVCRRFNEGYFSDTGAVTEAQITYIQANSLAERFITNRNVTIAELGFGFGLNFLLTAQLWQQLSCKNTWLDYIAFELQPVKSTDLKRAYHYWPELTTLGNQLITALPLPVPGFHLITFETLQIRCLLIYGDARHYLPQLQAEIDCWFLDAFSPKRNHELWQPEVFSQIYRLSHRASTLSTYSVARTVKEGVTKAGFRYHLVSASGRKKQRLVAYATDKMVPTTTNEKTSPSTAIIGCGVAGLCLAKELQQRGYVVSLFDAAPSVGHGASGAPAAVVRPWLSQDLNLDAQWSLMCYLTALEYWKSCSSHSEYFCRRPLMLRQKENQNFRELLENFSALTYLMSLVEEKTPLNQNNSGETEGLLFPLGGWLYPKKAVQELFAQLSGKCTFHFDHQLTKFTPEQSQWNCQFNHNIETSFDQIILANAAGISPLKQTTQIPVQSVAGQMNEITALFPNQLSHAICQPGFLLPDTSNRWHLGATFESVPKSVEQATTQLEDQMRILLAGIGASGTVEMQSFWRNTRACTLDHLPLVGAAPNYSESERDFAGKRTTPILGDLSIHPNIYLLSGFGSRGFTTIPASARYLASLIEGTVSPWPKRLSERVNPARFLLRQLKRD